MREGASFFPESRKKRCGSMPSRSRRPIKQKFVALLLGAQNIVLDEAVAFSLDAGQPHLRMALGRLGAATARRDRFGHARRDRRRHIRHSASR